MDTFGKKLRAGRDAKGFSQAELARQIKSHHSIVGKYERDEMVPSIQVAKTLAELLDTTVGYLLGEARQSDTFKDPAMLRRLNEITNLPDTDKEHILYTIDHLLASVKTRLAYE